MGEPRGKRKVNTEPGMYGPDLWTHRGPCTAHEDRRTVTQPHWLHKYTEIQTPAPKTADTARIYMCSRFRRFLES